MKGKGNRKLALLILSMLCSVMLCTLGLCTAEEVAGFLGGDELCLLLVPSGCDTSEVSMWVSALAQLPLPLAWQG